MTSPATAPGTDGWPVRVDIRRSSRRRRTVTARVEGDAVVVLMPAGLTEQQERQHVEHLLGRLQRQRVLTRLRREDLMARAVRLSETYFDACAVPRSVAWVGNQQHRWGSCSVSARTIRLSSQLDGMPDWVVDAVLVHELAHLLEPGHGARFQHLVRRYPRYERAMGFLDGYSHARRGSEGVPGPDDLDDDLPEVPDS